MLLKSFKQQGEAVGKRLSEMIPVRRSHSIVKKRGWYKSWLTGFSLFLRSQLYRYLVLYGIADMVSGSRVTGNVLLWNSNFFWNVRWEETGCILIYHFTSWKKTVFFFGRHIPEIILSFSRKNSLIVEEHKIWFTPDF